MGFLVLVFWFLIIVISGGNYIWDIICAIKYRRASVFDGRVERFIEKVLYQKPTRHTRGTYYWKYEVSYDYHGEKLVAEVVTVNDKLRPGDPIEVHVNDKTACHEVLSDAPVERIKISLISTVIAVVLGVVVIGAMVIFT
ncbi:hypothetical protein [Butyrivibrio proteoclasticus]|uniref:hypothetical protein n=1 Tax=Butyrivibrio proteoclasticus TaxID=43305 RepID=UPI000478A19C|nr:hypothetical protein [Butyrivibrio proteoclasticus]